MSFYNNLWSEVKGVALYHMPHLFDCSRPVEIEFPSQIFAELSQALIFVYSPLEESLRDKRFIKTRIQ